MSVPKKKTVDRGKRWWLVLGDIEREYKEGESLLSSKTNSLFQSIRDDSYDTLVELLSTQSEIDINKLYKNHLGLLSQATLKGNEEIIQLLLDNGADPLMSEYDGTYPLNLAIQKCSNQVIALLLKYVDIESINRRDVFGKTPLGDALENGVCKHVEVLLEHGANQYIPGICLSSKESKDVSAECISPRDFAEINKKELFLEAFKQYE